MYSFCMVLGAHVQDTTSQVRLHLPLACACLRARLSSYLSPLSPDL